nr:MAG TPA: hypothetical protein [Caudoviricetes sp.]
MTTLNTVAHVNNVPCGMIFQMSSANFEMSRYIRLFLFF